MNLAAIYMEITTLNTLLFWEREKLKNVKNAKLQVCLKNQARNNEAWDDFIKEVQDVFINDEQRLQFFNNCIRKAKIRTRTMDIADAIYAGNFEQADKIMEDLKNGIY